MPITTGALHWLEDSATPCWRSLVRCPAMEHAPIAETARTSQFRPLAVTVAEGFEPYFAVLVRGPNRV